MLHCMICPEQPNFSDVSHLLTHVASKAHLSNYFKLQVRSHQDVQALELLQGYDTWYHANNLSQLLSDRMTSKESRKKKRKVQARLTVESPVRPPPRRSRRTEPIDTDVHENNSFPDFLDPRLVANEHVKYEGETADEPFVSCYTPDTPAVTQSHTSSHVHVDPALTPSVNTADLDHLHQGGNHGHEEPIGLVLPVTPKPMRTRNRRSDMSLPRGNDMSDPFVDGSQRTRIPDDAEADRDRAEEIARLKGILWPGMDIFDSATQQMRRKRNQKKDGNVLKMMEITSLLVEPTELVFSPTGFLRRERVISGNVDDDSPLKGETPIPKRRPTRPKRNVLRQVDPNVLRGQDRKRAKNFGTRPIKTERTVLGDSSRSSRQFGHMSNLETSCTGLDSELELSVQAFGKRPHGSFAIFADDEHHDKQSFKDPHVNTKLPRETLTPARLMLDCKSDAPSNHGSKKSESPMNKENIEPVLEPRGRIDFQPWASPFLKRSGPADAVYAPRYFFDDQSSVSLRQEDDLEKCGYGPNPLLAPSSKTGFYGNKGNNLFDEIVAVTSSGWTAISQAVSDDATISEEDHDLARLYLNSHLE